MRRKMLKPMPRRLGFGAKGKAAEQVAVGAAIVSVARLRSVEAEGETVKTGIA